MLIDLLCLWSRLLYLYSCGPTPNHKDNVRTFPPPPKFFLFFTCQTLFNVLLSDMIKSIQTKPELPASIKIGYSQYSFDFWPDTFATTEDAQGEFFQVAHKIGLKKSTIPSIAGVNTLLHEVLHGVVYQWALDLGDKEEHTVNTIANGLTTVFVDNPWLVDYIKKHSNV